MYKVFLILLVSLVCRTSMYGQADWKLATEAQGIQVFTRSATGSNIKYLKLECFLDATIDQVVALLLDIPATAKWIPQTKTCSLLRKVSATDLFYYTEIQFPWPLYNRDFVTHLQLYQHPGTKVVTVDVPVISGELSPKEGIVRISNAKGQWVLSPQSNRRIKLAYSLFVDPGGFLPAILVNYFATQASVEIIKKMRELIQLPPYRNAALAFIEK